MVLFQGIQHLHSKKKITKSVTSNPGLPYNKIAINCGLIISKEICQTMELLKEALFTNKFTHGI
jgi:hypothetical protein